MTAWLASVWLTSLVGSLHCVAMCGPLSVLYARPHAKVYLQLIDHSGYHGARLVAYVLFGAVAGLMGKTLNTTGLAAGVENAAGTALGVSLIAWGVFQLLRRFRTPKRAPLRIMRHGGRVNGAKKWISAARHALLAHWLKASSPANAVPLRPIAFGISSALLPCGWLYGFVALAAATGTPVRGALLMMAFWLGTVPGLLGLGMTSHWLQGRIKGVFPVVSALLLVGAGAFVLVYRVTPTSALHPHAHGVPAQAHRSICH